MDVGVSTVRAYWWKMTEAAAARAGYGSNWRPSLNNFGDELSRPLLERLLAREALRVKPAEADVVSIGSLLTHLPARGWTGIIVGSGLLSSRQAVDISEARVLALRGTLTARRVRPRGDFALGDPGLLAPLLVDGVEQTHELGVVPHWTDRSLGARFKEGHVIDALVDDPVRVVREIASCRHIVSSSLHGVIVADAFGIPCQPEPFDEMRRQGGDFKFRDYSSALGVRFKFRVMREVPRARVERAQSEILEAFRQLATFIKDGSASTAGSADRYA